MSSERRPQPPRATRAGAGSSRRSGWSSARRARRSLSRRERLDARPGWLDLWTELRPRGLLGNQRLGAPRPDVPGRSLSEGPGRCNSPRRGTSNGGRGGSELAAEADEQRLERQTGAQVELLERAPRLADELAGALGAGESAGRPVGGELVRPVCVDERPLGSDGARHEVAVPRRELLQRCEQLVALGAPLDAPDPLLG